MKKMTILFLNALLLMSSLTASSYTNTANYMISAYKYTSTVAGTYSMYVYNSSLGSIGNINSTDSSAIEDMDIGPSISNYLYHTGSNAISDYNKQLLFSVLMFGTTTAEKKSSVEIKLTIDISAFSTEDDNGNIVDYIDGTYEIYNDKTTTLSADSNTSVSSSPSLNQTQAVTTSSSNANFVKSIVVQNSSKNSSETASWESETSIVLGIDESDYDTASLGDYAANVTITMEVN